MSCILPFCLVAFPEYSALHDSAHDSSLLASQVYIALCILQLVKCKKIASLLGYWQSPKAIGSLHYHFVLEENAQKDLSKRSEFQNHNGNYEVN